MRSKRVPPKEAKPAMMRVAGRLTTQRIPKCWRCGERLPTLTYLPLHRELDQQEQRDNGGLSPNDLYIDWREMAGWWFDGETLRPTDEHRERYRRACERVRTTPPTETRPTRLKLAGRAPHGRGLMPHEERRRQGGLVGFPTKRPAPQQIECLQCGVENLVELTSLSAAE